MMVKGERRGEGEGVKARFGKGLYSIGGTTTRDQCQDLGDCAKVNKETRASDNWQRRLALSELRRLGKVWAGRRRKQGEEGQRDRGTQRERPRRCQNAKPRAEFWTDGLFLLCPYAWCLN